MTVPVETSEVDYTGNGATTVFPVPFAFTANNQIIVTLAASVGATAVLQTLGVHYTLTGALSTSGTVTMLAAPGAGVALHIERTVLITQDTAFRTQGSFSPAVHENALDYGAFVDQQLSRRITALKNNVTNIQAGVLPPGIIPPTTPGVVPPSNTLQLLQFSGTNFDNAQRGLNIGLGLGVMGLVGLEPTIPCLFSGVIKSMTVRLLGAQATNIPPGAVGAIDSVSQFIIRKNPVANSDAYNTAMVVNFPRDTAAGTTTTNTTNTFTVVPGDLLCVINKPPGGGVGVPNTVVTVVLASS